MTGSRGHNDTFAVKSVGKVRKDRLIADDFHIPDHANALLKTRDSVKLKRRGAVGDTSADAGPTNEPN